MPIGTARLHAADLAALRGELDRLHDSYNVRDSAADPVQFVWRYDDPADREVVGVDRRRGWRSGALASVMASVERVLGAARAAPGAPTSRLRRRARRARRWRRSSTAGPAATISSRCSSCCASCGAARIARGRVPGRRRSGERRRRARRSRRSARAPAPWTCARPTAAPRRGRARRAATSSRGRRCGSACKRLNLFAALDGAAAMPSIPAAGRGVSRSQLVIPLDTHTIRVGRCLRLTRLHEPGLADGGRHHGDAAPHRSRRSRPLRLLALPHEHDGRVRMGAGGSATRSVRCVHSAGRQKAPLRRP